VRPASGGLAVLLVNKDPKNKVTATISLSGFTPAGTGTIYTYSETSGVIDSVSASSLDSSFNYTAAPYTLTTIVLK